MIFQDCYKLFNGWVGSAYGSVIEKDKILQNVRCKNGIMGISFEKVHETYNKMSKEVLLSEFHWEFLLRIQVMYKLNGNSIFIYINIFIKIIVFIRKQFAATISLVFDNNSYTVQQKSMIQSSLFKFQFFLIESPNRCANFYVRGFYKANKSTFLGYEM